MEITKIGAHYSKTLRPRSSKPMTHIIRYHLFLLSLLVFTATCSDSSNHSSSDYLKRCPRFADINSDEQCQCRVGFFGNKEIDQATCHACPAGRYSEKQGSFECKTCAAGTYSPQASHQCFTCAPGSISSSGAASCTDCPAGTYSETPGAAQCTPCKKGTYSENTGASQASTCTKCKVGTYSADDGAPQCTKCEAGFSSPPGAASCTAVYFIWSMATEIGLYLLNQHPCLSISSSPTETAKEGQNVRVEECNKDEKRQQWFIEPGKIRPVQNKKLCIGCWD